MTDLAEDALQAFHFLRCGGTVSLEAWNSLPQETKRALQVAADRIEEERAALSAMMIAKALAAAVGEVAPSAPLSREEALQRAARGAVEEARRAGG